MYLLSLWLLYCFYLIDPLRICFIKSLSYSHQWQFSKKLQLEEPVNFSFLRHFSILKFNSPHFCSNPVMLMHCNFKISCCQLLCCRLRLCDFRGMPCFLSYVVHCEGLWLYTENWIKLVFFCLIFPAFSSTHFCTIIF